MKKYNVKNYVRYKEDIKRVIKSIPKKRFIDYTSEELKSYIFTISRKYR
jgi:hypothetical protein